MADELQIFIVLNEKDCGAVLIIFGYFMKNNITSGSEFRIENKFTEKPSTVRHIKRIIIIIIRIRRIEDFRIEKSKKKQKNNAQKKKNL